MVRANADNLFGISSFIVDASASQGSFTTISSAITAAGAGPAVIYIKPGTYVGDLTLMPNVHLEGTDPGPTAVMITGQCAVNGNGTTNLSNLHITASVANDALEVFNAGVGTTTVNVINCILTGAGGGGRAIVTAGPSNVVTVIDTICTSILGDCVDIGGTSTVTLTNCSMTSTSGNALRQAGGGVITVLECRLTGASEGIEQSGGSLIEVYNSQINCTANAAINFSGGAATVQGFGNVYNCSAAGGNYVIGAAGTYIYADEINRGTATGIVGTITQTIRDWKPYASTSTVGTSRYNPLDFTVSASTGEVSLAGSGIFTWNTTAASVSPMVVQNGYIAIAAGGALTFGLPVAPVLGDTVRVSLDGATSWQITQPNAGSQIQFGSTATTVGVGGSLTSTAQGDSIELVARTADLWVTQSFIGNITVA